MAGHAQLKFVMTECSKTQIRLMGPKYNYNGTYKLKHVGTIVRNKGKKFEFQLTNCILASTCIFESADIPVFMYMKCMNKLCTSNT